MGTEGSVTTPDDEQAEADCTKALSRPEGATFPVPSVRDPLNTPYLRLMALADGADLTITHTFRRRTCTLIARNLRGVAVAGVSIPYLSFADSCEEMIRTLRGEV